jgi:hypothetical protein
MKETSGDCYFCFYRINNATVVCTAYWFLVLVLQGRAVTVWPYGCEFFLLLLGCSKACFPGVERHVGGSKQETKMAEPKDISLSFFQILFSFLSLCKLAVRKQGIYSRSFLLILREQGACALCCWYCAHQHSLSLTCMIYNFWRKKMFTVFMVCLYFFKKSYSLYNLKIRKIIVKNYEENVNCEFTAGLNKKILSCLSGLHCSSTMFHCLWVSMNVRE